MHSTSSIILAVVCALAGVAPGQVQTWIQDFETPGLLPHDASARFAWESQNGAPANGSPSPMANVANGVLEQRMTSASCGFAGGRGVFFAGDRAAGTDPHVTPSLVNSAWDSVIEARARFLAFDGGQTCALLLMEDLFGRYGIWFEQNGLRILGPNTLVPFSAMAPGFNPGQLHDYRIESDGGSLAMRVFVDGASVWTGTAPTTTTRNTVMWGDGSSPSSNDADVDWDWVRAYNGPGLFSSPPQWQVNQPAATLTVNNTTSDIYAPLRHAACVNATATVSATSTSAGMPWDLAYTVPEPGLAASGGGLTLSDGQVVNVDLGAPSLTFLNGFTFTTPFLSALSLPVTSALPVTACGQLVVIDPSQVTGYSLSALMELSFSNAGLISGLARGDDKSTVVPVTRPPLCAPSGINFAGQLYTRLSVSANGLVSFGGTNSSPLAGPSAFASLPAVAGCWTDLDNRPSAQGNDVVISQAGGVIRVRYLLVPTFGQPGTASSVDIVFDTLAGTTVMENYAPDPASLATSLVGLSPGGGATDPGAISFLGLVGSGGAGAATDMIYELGVGGPVPSGFNQIVFPVSDPTAFAVN